MAKYEAVIAALKATETDVVKGYGGNRAASTRARKALMEVRSLVQEARKELLEAGKGEVAARGVTAFFESE